MLREIDEEMTEDELDEIITEVSYCFVEILFQFRFADWSWYFKHNWLSRVYTDNGLTQAGLSADLHNLHYPLEYPAGT